MHNKSWNIANQTQKDRIIYLICFNIFYKTNYNMDFEWLLKSLLSKDNLCIIANNSIVIELF